MTNVRQWMLDRGIKPEVALDAGVRYDPNRNALLYPRTKLDGTSAGYKVRHLVGKRVYNDTSGIGVGDCQPWSAIDGGGNVLCLCEGETDALSLASNLFFFEEFDDCRVVCVPGANVFPNSWAGLFKDYDTIYLFPDPDKAGDQMVNKVAGLMARTKVVRLDPNYGDLNDNLMNNLFGLRVAIQEANSVSVTAKLRRTNYDFKRTHDVPNHILVSAVVRDTRLQKRGKEYYGKCPFHEDKTPSFSVDPVKGLFWCYSCQQGGDVISYLRHRYKISYSEALKQANKLR